MVFPATPVEEEMSTTVAGIHIPIQSFSVTSEDWVVAVVYADYPQFSPDLLPSEQDARDVLRGARDGAARRSRSIVLEESDGWWQGFPSLDFRMQSRDGVFVSFNRIVLAGRRQYHLTLGHRAGDPLPQAAQTALESFTIY
jgi:hypothetical protein